jgi:hypothetical protein
LAFVQRQIDRLAGQEARAVEQYRRSLRPREQEEDYQVQPPAGGGGSASPILLVQVKRNTGSGGDTLDPPSWTYDVYPVGADLEDPTALLAEDVPVLFGRQTPKPMTKAPDGTLALAVSSPDWTLLIALGEDLATVDCVVQ